MTNKPTIWTMFVYITTASKFSLFWSHLGQNYGYDMHFVWSSMWDGIFSPLVSESDEGGIRRLHLEWKTIQNAFSRILYTLRQFNQSEYTVQTKTMWDRLMSQRFSTWGKVRSMREKCKSNTPPAHSQHPSLIQYSLKSTLKLDCSVARNRKCIPRSP